LRKVFGVSILLVMGGSGDYFNSVDQVIAMDSFHPKLVTARAKQIVQDKPGSRKIKPASLCQMYKYGTEVYRRWISVESKNPT